MPQALIKRLPLLFGFVLGFPKFRRDSGFFSRGDGGEVLDCQAEKNADRRHIPSEVQQRGNPGGTLNTLFQMRSEPLIRCAIPN